MVTTNGLVITAEEWTCSRSSEMHTLWQYFLTCFAKDLKSKSIQENDERKTSISVNCHLQHWEMQCGEAVNEGFRGNDIGKWKLLHFLQFETGVELA